jgi:HK97 family phage prohead protease
MTKNTEDMIELGLPIEVKFLGDGSSDLGVFEGYGATFDGIDAQGDTIVPGAFSDSIAQHQADGTAPALLWNHSMNEPVGKLIGLQEDSRGLRVKGKLNLNTAAGVKAHEHLKAGDVTGLSIGYTVPPGGQEKQRAGPRILKKLNLHEVSIASMPADTNARVSGVKMLTSLGELERGLRGEVQLKLSRGAAAKIAAVGWPALVGGDDDPPQPDPAIVAAARATRIAVAALATKIDTAVLELKSLKSMKGN